MEQAFNDHVPVMLQEVVDLAQLHQNSLVVDMTLGRGGHSSAFLAIVKRGFLYGVDRDESAIAFSAQRLAAIGPNFATLRSNFAAAPEKLRELGMPMADFVFYDLGVSSPQFDDPQRGFSYRFDADLDMRMNRESSLTAAKVVNETDPGTLIRALYEFADESYAKQIVHNIVKHRQVKKIATTFELVSIVKEALPAKELRKPGHPAKKTFLGIRYLVNAEKDEIVRGLPSGLELLRIGGRLAVITFNSYEDGLVKAIFKKMTSAPVVDKFRPPVAYEINYRLITRKPLSPTADEIAANNRAKPAKLRVIERIK